MQVERQVECRVNVGLKGGRESRLNAGLKGRWNAGLRYRLAGRSPGSNFKVNHLSRIRRRPLLNSVFKPAFKRAFLTCVF